MSKVDFSVLENYSEADIRKFNEIMEAYIEGTLPSSHNLKEAVSYFYLTLHKLENEPPMLDVYRFEYQHIYTHHIEKLKARLLNLVDSMTTDERQANSMKGLIKDFCNMAHLDGRNELDKWALEAKIINKGDMIPVANLK